MKNRSLLTAALVAAAVAAGEVDLAIVLDPDGEGGVLRFQWDRAEAYVPIEVAGG